MYVCIYVIVFLQKQLNYQYLHTPLRLHIWGEGVGGPMKIDGPDVQRVQKSDPNSVLSLFP